MSVNLDKSTASAVHIHVGHNIPGYLPESDIMCFDSVESALDALRHEIKDQQGYYYEQCDGHCDECAEFEACGDPCACAWCDSATDCEADLSAIADGDAAYAFNRDRGLSYGYEPPEGPNIRHWMIEVADNRDDCEIFADQDA
jgi:hypothetical protein